MGAKTKAPEKVKRGSGGKLGRRAASRIGGSLAARGPGSGRGGARAGAGRKKGGFNAGTITMQINSKAILERMREQIFADITPLEFLLDIMRNDAMPYLERRDAAVVCLPYCHPKLIAAVVRNDQNDGSYPILERIERVIRETDGSTARIERGTTLADIDSKVVSAVPGGGEVQGSVGRKRVG